MGDNVTIKHVVKPTSINAAKTVGSDAKMNVKSSAIEMPITTKKQAPEVVTTTLQLATGAAEGVIEDKAAPVTKGIDSMNGMAHSQDPQVVTSEAGDTKTSMETAKFVRTQSFGTVT